MSTGNITGRQIQLLTQGKGGNITSQQHLDPMSKIVCKYPWLRLLKNWGEPPSGVAGIANLNEVPPLF